MLSHRLVSNMSESPLQTLTHVILHSCPHFYCLYMSKSVAWRPLQILRNFLLDIRYQRRFLGGTVPTKFKQLGAQETANSDYDALPQLFAHPAIWEGSRKFSPEHAIVDVGCGKGRVINWLLSQGFRGRIIGVELDPDIAQSTSARLKTYANVSVVQADVLHEM